MTDTRAEPEGYLLYFFSNEKFKLRVEIFGLPKITPLVLIKKYDVLVKLTKPVSLFDGKEVYIIHSDSKDVIKNKNITEAERVSPGEKSKWLK